MITRGTNPGATSCANPWRRSVEIQTTAHRPAGQAVVMNSTTRVRTARRGWDALSTDEKQHRLAELRRRQQAQVKSELRLLSVIR